MKTKINKLFLMFWALLLLLLLLVVVGCESDDTLYATESCFPYFIEIQEAVDRYNELEKEDFFIEKDSTGHMYKNPSDSRKDQINFVYCSPETGYGTGRSPIGIGGDVVLYPNTLDKKSDLVCTVLHELGHYVLGYRDNNNPETIMYRYWQENCENLERWE